MTKFYSRKGDDGYTGLLGEGRVPKYHPQPEAFGTIDEASAAIGLARSFCQDPQSVNLLLEIQRDLYNMMAEVAATPENAASFRKIDQNRVIWLENQTDTIAEMVEMPKEFIVPGDSTAGAALAVARTIVRRAERQIARLLHDDLVENEALLHYLNRLSSFCFVLELHENALAGKDALTLAKNKKQR